MRTDAGCCEGYSGGGMGQGKGEGRVAGQRGSARLLIGWAGEHCKPAKLRPPGQTQQTHGACRCSAPSPPPPPATAPATATATADAPAPDGRRIETPPIRWLHIVVPLQYLSQAHMWHSRHTGSGHTAPRPHCNHARVRVDGIHQPHGPSHACLYRYEGTFLRTARHSALCELRNALVSVT